jgi:hypothetical protein
MTAINYAAIDEDYPVAGVDNDSQGFRDNFSVIKSGLATAESRLQDLETNTAKLNDGNDFNGNLIDNAVVNRLYGLTYSMSASGTTTLSVANGPYQVVTITGNATLRFQDWPTVDNRYASVRIGIKSNGTSANVTWTTVGGGAITYLSSGLENLTTGVDQDAIRIVEAWSSDQGDTVYLADVVTTTTSTIALNDLLDVNTDDVTDAQILKFDSGSNGWVVGDNNLETLGDVLLNEPATGEALRWNGTKWVNQSIAADTNTTYSVGVQTTLNGAAVRLTGSDSSTDDIKVLAGTGITVTPTDDSTITITNTVANTDTTYSISAETVTGGTNLRLTGSDTSTDNVKLAGGTNVTITRTNDSTITFDVACSRIENGTNYVSVDSSGNVTLPSSVKFNSDGTISTELDPGTFWNYDCSASVLTLTSSDTVNFANFSGSVLVNCWNSGTVTQYLCGGGAGGATEIGSSKTGFPTGTMADNSGINGYTFTATETGDHSFYVIRTRTGA